MKYFSLFSGIGGFELGIQNAFQNISHAKEQQHEEKNPVGKSSWVDSNSQKQRLGNPICVGYSEIDKYAIQVYQSHFPEHKNYGDITKINADELPDFDFLVGGFPCQSFSIAGKRGGFSDTRGTLFFDIARILQSKKPQGFLLENVKGLLSHENGATFKTIIATLDELGYDLQWQVLNSKNHGVPQNRERIYIIGNLRGTSRPQVFPFGETTRTTDKRFNQTNTQITSTLRSRYGNGSGSHIKVVGSLNSDGWEKRNESSRRVYDTEGIAPTIPTATGGGTVPKVLVREATKKGYAEAEAEAGDSINFSNSKSTTRRGRVGKKIAQTLDTGMQQYTLQKGIRRLTPVECERLQGFPDGWTAMVSDSQRYKCCGNAVTTNVIQAVIEKLL